MAWFKVDDDLLTHRKVIMIPRTMRLQCMGLWAMVGSWSSNHLTDGHVSSYVLDELGGIPELRDELIRVGLWESDDEGGIHFHDWKDYQPSREEVEAKRLEVSKKRSEAGKKGMASRWSDNKITNPLQTDNKPITPTRPDPTPSISKEIERRATRLPATFEITEEMSQWFERQNFAVDINLETENFKDYWNAKAGADALKLDWVATWRSWIRRSQSFLPEKATVDPWAGKEHLGFAK
jgi:hypothetical protein